MPVYEITVDGGDDLKESVSRLLCPDPGHAATGCAVSAAEARESAHPALVEQYWTERGLRA